MVAPSPAPETSPGRIVILASAPDPKWLIALHRSTSKRHIIYDLATCKLPGALRKPEAPENEHRKQTSQYPPSSSRAFFRAKG
mmetsp:Transcript_18395/g.29317  ORF Transcript_18395/g.29317 Transcript_18395/m.29317 type:complete len:83 (+) Transcript_18395:784-1032(+)